MIALNFLQILPTISNKTVKNHLSYASTKFQRPVIDCDVTIVFEGPLFCYFSNFAASTLPLKFSIESGVPKKENFPVQTSSELENSPF